MACEQAREHCMQALWGDRLHAMLAHIANPPLQQALSESLLQTHQLWWLA